MRTASRAASPERPSGEREPPGGTRVNDRSTAPRARTNFGTVNVEAPRRIGRYALHRAIGSGGMATVHLGRLFGPRGFARIVAIKRLHAAYADDPDFTVRFMQEARLASRIRHPNVVPVLDVLAEGGELSLVMEYVEGESLARLLRIARERGSVVPVAIAAAIIAGVLHGLHAAHESEGEDGKPLGVVHRDVSPQNIIVGADGVARLLDFGVAKAVGLAPATRGGAGAVGKLSYMAPEQIRREAVSPRTDVYAAAVVLWEAICGRRLFRGEDEADVAEQILIGLIAPPSKFAPTIDDALERLVRRGLATEPRARPDAREMATALEPFSALRSTVAAWLADLASDRLAERAMLVRSVERAGPLVTDTDATPPTRAAAVVPSRLRPVVIAGALSGVLAVAAGAWALSAGARGTPPAPVVALAVPAPESLPMTPNKPAPAAGSVSADASLTERTAARLPSPPAPPRTTPIAPRPPLPVASTAPSASARRCESIDPKTGDIHFDRSCR